VQARRFLYFGSRKAIVLWRRETDAAVHAAAAEVRAVLARRGAGAARRRR
jgi:hypothetical protein